MGDAYGASSNFAEATLDSCHEQLWSFMRHFWVDLPTPEIIRIPTFDLPQIRFVCHSRYNFAHADIPNQYTCHPGQK
jgi:hypothetical protein